MPITCNSSKRPRKYHVCSIIPIMFSSFEPKFEFVVFVLDLESEMYQLSHLLIEQRNILSTLREQNSTDDTKGVLLDEPAKGKEENEL